jgi:hypothetical protein
MLRLRLFSGSAFCLFCGLLAAESRGRARLLLNCPLTHSLYFVAWHPHFGFAGHPGFGNSAPVVNLAFVFLF